MATASLSRWQRVWCCHAQNLYVCVLSRLCGKQAVYGRSATMRKHYMMTLWYNPIKALSVFLYYVDKVSPRNFEMGWKCCICLFPSHCYIYPCYLDWPIRFNTIILPFTKGYFVLYNTNEKNRVLLEKGLFHCTSKSAISVGKGFFFFFFFTWIRAWLSALFTGGGWVEGRGCWGAGGEEPMFSDLGKFPDWLHITGL